MKVKEESRAVENMLRTKTNTRKVGRRTTAASSNQSREGTPLRSLDNLTGDQVGQMSAQNSANTAVPGESLDTPATNLLQQMINQEQEQSNDVVIGSADGSVREHTAGVSQVDHEEMTSDFISSDIPVSVSTSIPMSTSTSVEPGVDVDTPDSSIVDGITDQGHKPSDTVVLELVVHSEGKETTVDGLRSDVVTSEDATQEETTYTELRTPVAATTPVLHSSKEPSPVAASVQTPTSLPPEPVEDGSDDSDQDMASIGGDVDMSDSDVEESFQQPVMPDDDINEETISKATVEEQQAPEATVEEQQAPEATIEETQAPEARVEETQASEPIDSQITISAVPISSLSSAPDITAVVQITEVSSDESETMERAEQVPLIISQTEVETPPSIPPSTVSAIPDVSVAPEAADTVALDAAPVEATSVTPPTSILPGTPDSIAASVVTATPVISSPPIKVPTVVTPVSPDVPPAPVVHTTPVMISASSMGNAPVILSTPVTSATTIESSVSTVQITPTVPTTPVEATTSAQPIVTVTQPSSIIPSTRVEPADIPEVSSATSVVTVSSSSIVPSVGQSTIVSTSEPAAPVVNTGALPPPVPVALHLADDSATPTLQQVQETPQKQVFITPSTSAIVPTTTVEPSPVVPPESSMQPLPVEAPATPVQPPLPDVPPATPELPPTVVPAVTPVQTPPEGPQGTLTPVVQAASPMQPLPVVPPATPVQMPSPVVPLATPVQPPAGGPQGTISPVVPPGTLVQPPPGGLQGTMSPIVPPGTPVQPHPGGLQRTMSQVVPPGTPVQPPPAGVPGTPSTPLLTHLASVVQQGGQLQPISTPLGAIQSTNVLGNAPGGQVPQNMIVVGSAPAVPVFIPGIGYMYGYLPGSMQLTPAGLTTNQWNTNMMLGNSQPVGLPQMVPSNIQQPMMIAGPGIGQQAGVQQMIGGTPGTVIGGTPGMMPQITNVMGVAPSPGVQQVANTMQVANVAPQPFSSCAPGSSLQTMNIAAQGIPGVQQMPLVNQAPPAASLTGVPSLPPNVPTVTQDSAVIQETSPESTVNVQALIRPVTHENSDQSEITHAVPGSETLSQQLEQEQSSVQQGESSVEAGDEMFEESAPLVIDEGDVTSSPVSSVGHGQKDPQGGGNVNFMKSIVRVIYADGSSKIRVEKKMLPLRRKEQTVRRRLERVHIPSDGGSLSSSLPKLNSGGLSGFLPKLDNDDMSSHVPKLADHSSAYQTQKSTQIPMSFSKPVESTRNLANLPQQITTATSQIVVTPVSRQQDQVNIGGQTTNRQIQLVTLPASSSHPSIPSAGQTSLHPLPNVRTVANILPPTSSQQLIAQPIETSKQKARIWKPGSTNGKPPPRPTSNIPVRDLLRQSGHDSLVVPGRQQVRMLRPVNAKTISGVPVKHFGGKKMPSHMQDRNGSVNTSIQNQNPSNVHHQENQSGLEYTLDPVTGMMIPIEPQDESLTQSGPPPVQRLSQNTVQRVDPEQTQAKVAELNQMAEQVLGTDASEEKSIPLLPPNSATLMALKTLLLQRKMLEKKASGYQSSGQSEERVRRYQGYMASKSQEEGDSFHHEPRQESSTTSDEPHPLAHVLATRDFKRLQERFMSVFAWPALLSTVPPRCKQRGRPAKPRIDEAGTEPGELRSMRKRNAKHLQGSVSRNEEPTAKVPKPSEPNPK